MAREFFKNLPNTTTPLTAPRINALLDGDEAMGNIVVDSIRSKNLINISKQEINLIKSSNRSITLTPNNNVILEPGTYTISFSDLIMTNNNYPLYVEIIGLGMGASAITNKANTFTINEQKTITSLYIFLSSDDNNNATATFSMIQIEKGSTATDYALYQGIGYVSGKTANGNYIKYDDGTLICYNQTTITGQAIDSTYQGGKCYYSTKMIAFPMSFLSTPAVNIGQAEWGDSISWASASYVATSSFETVFYDFVSRDASRDIKFSWIAIGRWK